MRKLLWAHFVCGASLALAIEGHSPRKPDPSDCTSPLATPPLLIFDGDDGASHLLSFYVRHHGFEPLVSQTLIDADRKRLGHPLVGALIHLPGDDVRTSFARMAFARRLRDEHGVPVVLLSDEMFTEDEVEGFLKLGRPLDTSALDSALRRFVPERPSTAP